MMGAFAAYFFWMVSKQKKAILRLGPAMHGFFTKTGFRYSHLPPEPVEAHVNQAMIEAQDRTLHDRVVQYVCSFHGMPVHFKGAYLATSQGMSISTTWSTPLRAPVRVPFT